MLCSVWLALRLGLGSDGLLLVICFDCDCGFGWFGCLLGCFVWFC